MNRMSVQIPIVVGFSLILLILAAVISVNISQIRGFSEQIKTIVLERNQKSELAAYMKRLQRSRHRSLLYASALEDPFERDEEIRYYHELAGDFIKAREKFIRLPMDKAETAIWEQIRGEIRRMEAETAIVLPHIEDNRLELARRLIKARLVPFQERLMASWSRLVDMQRERNKSAMQEADQLEDRLTRLSLWLGVAAFLLGLAVAYAASRFSRLLENALREEKDRAQLILESISEAVIRLNAKSEICYINPYAERILGLQLGAKSGCKPESLLQLVDKGTREPLTSALLEDLRKGRRFKLPPNCCLVSAEGMEYDVEGSAAPLMMDERLMGAVIVFRDVTENREELRRHTGCGNVDPVTGLADSMALESRLGSALRGKCAEDQPLAFLLIQHGKLDEIRNAVGLAGQQALLRQIGALLRTCIRDSDMLAMMDDQSFGILLISCPEAKARQIAAEIRDKLNQFRLTWEGHIYPLDPTVGLVQVPPFTGTLQDCFQAAANADSVR